MITASGLVVGLYVLPGESHDIPQVQPAIRIETEADFPIGASRVQNWGDAPILVVRTAETEFHALQGVSPADGCLLRWDSESLRVVSPCTHLVYDLRGNVVLGLTREPLLRYPVFVRDGVVYVATRPTAGS
jgi:nitrite reductase/ring-hydroxylating ferredoxin subunit